ncbi:MAG TPA: ubiquitin-activating E1 FCCH domain-containing protein [Pirellulaceae bacterium]|jgi:hypothetical protein|nr:ubiquitin-activating E1 FCCH domain-containing protein [Pirellulaceae bacterium]
MASSKLQDLDQKASLLTSDLVAVAGSNYLEATISGITQANPAVVTATAHGYSNDDEVYIDNVLGMTQVNGLTFTVAGVTTNTFQLSGVNSSAYTAYASSGTVVRGRLQKTSLSDLTLAGLPARLAATGKEITTTWDDATETGWYYGTGVDFISGAMAVRVLNVGSNVFQELYRTAAPYDRYLRQRVSGTWSPFVRLDAVYIKSSSGTLQWYERNVRWSGSAGTLTLPSGTQVLDGHEVEIFAGNGNAITVAAGSGSIFSAEISATSITFSGAGSALRLKRDGSNWNVVGRREPVNPAFASASTATTVDAHLTHKVKCGGASDYTITISAATATDDYCEFVNVGSAVVTLDPASTAQVYEAPGGVVNTLKLWPGESAFVQWDGAFWVVVSHRQIGHYAEVVRHTAQSLPNATLTAVTMTATTQQRGVAINLANVEPITIQRTGRYMVSAAFAHFNADVRIHVVVNGNSMWLASGETVGSVGYGTASQVMFLAAGATVGLQVEQNSGATQNTSTGSNARPTLAIAELL